jgi:hypothetical protein
VDGAGRVVLRKTVRREQFGSDLAAVPDRHGGVFGVARMGTAIPGARAHGAADGAGVRGALKEERQERRQRRRGDL